MKKDGNFSPSGRFTLDNSSSPFYVMQWLVKSRKTNIHKNTVALKADVNHWSMKKRLGKKWRDEKIGVSSLSKNFSFENALIEVRVVFASYRYYFVACETIYDCLGPNDWWMLVKWKLRYVRLILMPNGLKLSIYTQWRSQFVLLFRRKIYLTKLKFNYHSKHFQYFNFINNFQ